jgi:biofilm PGA synthesis N-glycosyltransferase PgaC
MQIVIKGFKSIFEEFAIAYEDVAPTMESEFKRHVRDGAGHYIAVIHLLGLLNPFLGIRSFIYWPHRILRWAVPFILIILFVINCTLLNYTYCKVIFVPHVGFYMLALIGWLRIKGRRLPFFLYIPFYFCNLNLALLVGFIKVISGMQKTTWERTERTE